MVSEPDAGRSRRIAAKVLRIAGIVAVVLAATGAIVAAFASSRYFASAVEAGLSRALLEEKHRTLKFAGPLRFSFWPDAGFEAEGISLSERDGTEEFASLGTARFSIAVMPLLAGRIVVDRCSVDGLKARVVRRRDGTLNIDDLLGGETSAGKFRIEVANARATNAALVWHNETSHAEVRVDGLELSISGLDADTSAGTAQAKRIKVTGRTGGLRLGVDATEFSAVPGAISMRRAELELAYAADGSSVDATLGAPVVVDTDRGSVDLRDLSGDLAIVHPQLAHAIKLPLRGGFRATDKAAEGKLSARLDGSNADIAVRIDGYSPLALHFDIDVDRLDIDRYLSPVHEAAAASGRGSPTNLSGLGRLDAEGTATIGELRVAGVTTRNIQLEIRRSGGKLDVKGVRGK